LDGLFDACNEGCGETETFGYNIAKYNCVETPCDTLIGNELIETTASLVIGKWYGVKFGSTLYSVQILSIGDAGGTQVSIVTGPFISCDEGCPPTEPVDDELIDGAICWCCLPPACTSVYVHNPLFSTSTTRVTFHPMNWSPDVLGAESTMYYKITFYGMNEIETGTISCKPLNPGETDTPSVTFNSKAGNVQYVYLSKTMEGPWILIRDH